MGRRTRSSMAINSLWLAGGTPGAMVVSLDKLTGKETFGRAPRRAPETWLLRPGHPRIRAGQAGS